MKKITVVIPTYNEEKSIGLVIRRIIKNIDIYQIIVVDDGSSDRSAYIAEKAGANIIQNKHNRGTGFATKAGLSFAAKTKTDMVVLMDADGQHNPIYLPRLINEMRSGVDMVIGSRYMVKTKNCTSLFRRMGTKCIFFLITLVYGKKIYDPTSGFRVMNRRMLNHFADHYPTTFSEPEVVINMLKNNFFIKETSIEMMPRWFGKTTIKPLKAVFLMGYISVKIFLDVTSGYYKQ
jgi:glycosyltransferase involved in cell wall biosynthesis